MGVVRMYRCGYNNYRIAGMFRWEESFVDFVG